MNKPKNKRKLRTITLRITAQSLYNLYRLADISEVGSLGRVVDKLVREKMISLHTPPIKTDDTISRAALLESIDGIYDCSDLVFKPNDHPCNPEDCAGCKWSQTVQALRCMVENAPAVQKGARK